MKKLINAFKLWALRILLTDLCGNSKCRNCKAYMEWNPTSRPLCAQSCVYDQSIQVWGLKGKK